MPEPIVVVKIDDSDLKRKFKLLGEKAADGRPPLKTFFQYYRTVVGMMFQQAGKATGGSARGVSWRGFAPQYTRKTDGVTVPAWGGVPRVNRRFSERGKMTASGLVRIERVGRKGGKVQGRLRPSGQRVRQSSMLMRDTKKMFSEFTRRPLELTRNHMRIGTVLDYAEYQNRMRLFAFFTADDQTKFTGFVGSYLNELCRQHGLS